MALASPTSPISDYSFMQAVTFANWINVNLAVDDDSIKVNDVFIDLRNGTILLRLIKLLVQKRKTPLLSCDLNPERGSLRIHMISNVKKVLNAVDDIFAISTAGMNISAEDIVDGNPNITLGLVWLLILRFDIYRITGVCSWQECSRSSSVTSLQHANREGPVEEKLSARKIIMDWVREIAAKTNVEFNGENWRNGSLFECLLEELLPGSIIPEGMNSATRMRSIFSTFEDRLGVHQLLDVDGFIRSRSIDDRSLITYLSMLYQRWRDRIHFSEWDEVISFLNSTNLSNALVRIAERYAAIEHDILRENHLFFLFQREILFENSRSAISSAVTLHLELEVDFVRLNGQFIDELRSSTARDPRLSQQLVALQHFVNERSATIFSWLASLKKIVHILNAASDLIDEVEIGASLEDAPFDYQAQSTRILAAMDKYNSLLSYLPGVLGSDYYQDTELGLQFLTVGILTHCRTVLDQIDCRHSQRASISSESKIKSAQRRNSLFILNTEEALEKELEECHRIEKAIRDYPVPDLILSRDDLINCKSNLHAHFSKLESRLDAVDRNILEIGLEIDDREELDIGSETMRVRSKIHSLSQSVLSSRSNIESLLTLVDSYYLNALDFFERVDLAAHEVRNAISSDELLTCSKNLDNLALDLPSPSSELMVLIFRVFVKSEKEIVERTRRLLREFELEMKDAKAGQLAEANCKIILAELENLEIDIRSGNKAMENSILSLDTSCPAALQVETLRDQMLRLERQMDEMHMLHCVANHPAFGLLITAEELAATYCAARKLFGMKNQLKKLSQILLIAEDLEDLKAHIGKWSNTIGQCIQYVNTVDGKNRSEKFRKVISSLCSDVRSLCSECEILLVDINHITQFFQDISITGRPTLERRMTLAREIDLILNVITREVNRFRGSDYSMDMLEAVNRKLNNELQTGSTLLFQNPPESLKKFPHLLQTVLKFNTEFETLEMELLSKKDEIPRLIDTLVQWTILFIRFNSAENALDRSHNDSQVLTSFALPSLGEIEFQYTPLNETLTNWISAKAKELVEKRDDYLEKLAERKSSNCNQLEFVDVRLANLRQRLPDEAAIFAATETISPTLLDQLSLEVDLVMSDFGVVWSQITHLEDMSDLSPKRDAMLDNISYIRSYIERARQNDRLARRIRSIGEEIVYIESSMTEDGFFSADLIHELEYVKRRVECVDVVEIHGSKLKNDLVGRIEFLIKQQHCSRELKLLSERSDKYQRRCEKILSVIGHYKSLAEDIAREESSISRIASEILTTKCRDDESKNQLIVSLSNLIIEVDCDPLFEEKLSVSQLRSSVEIEPRELPGKEKLIMELDLMTTEASAAVDFMEQHRDNCGAIGDIIKFLQASRQIVAMTDSLRASAVDFLSLSEGNISSNILKQQESIYPAISALGKLLDNITAAGWNTECCAVAECEYALLQNMQSQFKAAILENSSDSDWQKFASDLLAHIETLIENCSRNNSDLPRNINRQIFKLEKLILFKLDEVDTNGKVSYINTRLALIKAQIEQLSKSANSKKRIELYVKMFEECKRLIANVHESAAIYPEKTYNGIREYSGKIARLRRMIRVYNPSVNRLLALLEKHDPSSVDKDFEAINQIESRQWRHLKQVWERLLENFQDMESSSKLPVWNGTENVDRKCKRRYASTSNLLPSRLPIMVAWTISSEQRSTDDNQEAVASTSPNRLYGSARTLPSPAQSKDSLNAARDIDKAILDIIHDYPVEVNIRRSHGSNKTATDTSGHFMLSDLNGEKVIYCELRGTQVILRVGGGWQPLKDYLVDRYFLGS
eukprot:Partr_v1_DN28820_c2_g1_i1_m34288 putative Dystrophin